MAGRIVVEWTRASFRIAWSEGRGKHPKLSQVRSIDLSQQELTGDAVRQLLGKASPAGKVAVMVIPRDQVITRGVRFPTTQKQELDQMIEYYCRAQLPYPREQMLIDYAVLGEVGGYSTVTVVACQTELIQRNLALLRQAGLDVQIVTVSSWGVAEWYRRLPEKGSIQEPTLVIHVDDTRTDFVLIADGRVLLGRSLAQGAQDWSDVDHIIELLTIEVERSRSSLRKELADLDVRSIVLTGIGPTADWREPLSQRLGLPVLAADVNRGLAPWSGMPGPWSPVVIGGLACGDLGRVLTLTPPELKQQVHGRRQVEHLTTIGLLLGAVLVLAAGLLWMQVYRYQQFGAQIDAAVAELAPRAKTVQDKRRLAGVIGGVLQHRHRLAGMLGGIVSSMPDSMSMDILSFDRARPEFVLRGMAPSTQLVLDYIAKLKAVPSVKDVHLKYTRQRVLPEGERTEFELVLVPGEI